MNHIISNSARFVRCTLTASQHRSCTIAALRNIHVSSSRHDIFNVQDTGDFEERVLKSDKPVLIDFHAKWCGPCKQLTPRLIAAIEQFKDQVHLAQVDIDEQDEIAMQYEISAVPVVYAMKKGKVTDKFIGLQDPDRISSFIKALVDK